MTRLLSLIVVAFAFIYAIESAVVKTPVAVSVSPAAKTPVVVSATGKACSPVNCHGKVKKCAYGYQKKDGCEICKCDDPCNPIGKAKLCGANQRCHVEKKPDGTFGSRCDAAPAKKGKGAKVSKEACSQPSAPGACRAALPRFFYNSATKTCEKFNYGGCGGNENNFKTIAECEKLCKA